MSNYCFLKSQLAQITRAQKNNNTLSTGDRGRCAVDLYVSRFDPRHEDSVTVHELSEGVSDGVTGPSDPDGLHHAGVTKLTDTKLPVE